MIKKIIIGLAAFFIIAGSVSAQLSPVITSWIRDSDAETGYGGILSNVQIVQYDASNVYVSCTCIPGYSIGPWNSDPNIPSNQNFVFKITRNPQKNSGKLTVVGLGQIGVWSNGVAVYNASDGMTYNNDGVWHRNAYYFEGVSFDDCLGHPDQSGCYHHHVNPKCLYNDSDSKDHSPIIGYAFDGYPIYGAYGYANPDGSGGIKRMRSSYQLRTNMVNRDTLPTGAVASQQGPPVSATYPLGDFMEDYKYVAGSGDLDTNNGRYCVTPDYPNGTYAYFVTIDSTRTPVYPYVLGLTYYGVVQTGNTGPGSGHNTPSDSTIIYTGVSNVVRKQINVTLEPNPVTDYAYFYIEPSSDNNITGALYDINGKVLKAYQNLQPSMSYSINLTAYPAGIYFLRLQTANATFSKKIVKVQ